MNEDLDEEDSEEAKEMDSFSDDETNDRRISTAEDSRKNSKDLRTKFNIVG